MKGGLPASLSKGFTVVEVLIVLAVSSAIFLLAAVLIGGKQTSTEFAQAINDVQSQMQQMINNVTNGYYSNNHGFQCTAGTPPTVTNINVQTQGANEGCILLGQVLQFAPQNQPSQVNVYTVAGNQAYGSGCQLTQPVSTDCSPTQTLAQAFPIVLASTQNQSLPVKPTTLNLEFGTTVKCLQYYTSTFSGSGSPCSSGTAVGAVGFVTDPSNTSATNTAGVSSGSQIVDTMVPPDVQLNQPGDGSSTVDVLNCDLEAGSGGGCSPSANYVLNPGGGVQICFLSGDSKRSGLLSVGGNGRQPVLKLSLKNSQDCS